MNRIFLLPVLLLVGCAQAPRMPVDVSLIPNDCANRHAIESWLEKVSTGPKPYFQSQQDYEQHISQVKERLWSLRYHCEPAPYRMLGPSTTSTHGRSGSRAFPN
jgi:hypothetical protein